MPPVMSPAQLSDSFSSTFRAEHRLVRDALLELADAFRARDPEQARNLLGRVAALTGPHFRYEEESLYPALVPVFGEAYVEKLLADHDGAIQAARRLVELAGSGPLTETEASEAVELVRGVLPHVSDCEGLSIMVELLEPEAVQTILDTREGSLEEGLDLLAWADRVRGRRC